MKKPQPEKMYTYKKIATYYGLSTIAVKQTSLRNGWSIQNINGLREILNYYHNKYGGRL